MEVCEAFKVDSRRYYVWKRQLDETGKPDTYYRKINQGKIDPEKLLRLLAEYPDWYLDQFVQVFGVWYQSIQKRFTKMGITRKKTFTYSEKPEAEREKFLREPEENTGRKPGICGRTRYKRGLNEGMRRAASGVKAEDTNGDESFTA